MTLRTSLLFAASLSLPLFGACADGEPVDPIDLTTSGSSGGSSPTATTGVTATGTGGQGGNGGNGGNDLGFCGQDCSLVDTMNPCLVAVCNEGQLPGPIGDCVVTPDEGATCDDGLFCTTDDACDGEGECVGGADNTCGLDASDCEDVACDEDDDVCEIVPKTNGEMCASDNLCTTDATCLNGLCQGGNVEDCFLQPTPNECYASVCNPQNGMCEPIIANDGGTCTDVNDPCTVDKTCNNGACVGGIPKDCSGAAQECEVGVCDMATGQCMGAPGMSGQSCMGAADECNSGTCDMSGTCTPVPLASGTSCASAADECNVGECDGSGSCAALPIAAGTMCMAATDQCNLGQCDGTGSCTPVPVADGTVCNDNQACTTGDSCQAGVCTGSTTATCSQTPDGCCPSTCDATNDTDCDCPGIDVAGTCVYLADTLPVSFSAAQSACQALGPTWDLCSPAQLCDPTVYSYLASEGCTCGTGACTVSSLPNVYMHVSGPDTPYYIRDPGIPGCGSTTCTDSVSSSDGAPLCCK